jgi:hypothetical protein
MIRTLTIIVLSGGCLVADEPRQKIQVTSKQRVDFASGESLRITNSVGDLTVEGWFRSEVEITTIKTTKASYDSRTRPKSIEELDQVRSALDRRGSELVLTTDLPRSGTFSPPLPLSPRVDLEYRIMAPRNVRLVVDQDAGEVNLGNLTGDIHVTVSRGHITFDLPHDARYAIDARSKFGHADVFSNLPLHERRGWWMTGHRLDHEEPSPAHKLFVRVGSGDISGLIQTPTPESILNR